MKTKYIVLLLFVVAIFLMRVDWDKVQNPEYRKITSFSEAQRQVFEKRLAATVTAQTRIYLRDLVDFEWDTVCAMDSYSIMRKDLAQPTSYGKDIPELELFPSVPETGTAFVFLKNDKLAAVISHYEPRLRGVSGNCASPKYAVLKFINKGASVTDKVRKSNNYTARHSDIKANEGCNWVECYLTFHGTLTR